ncbi:MAG TPA: hypothetical protein VK645_19270, partial [Chitinophagaceae bacterium]|nr:hypothetical protein [Chitinophagaceae bacterium]
GWFGIDSMDLTGVRSIAVNSRWQELPKGFDFEARLDAPDGKLLGKGALPAPIKGQQSGVAILRVEPVTDGKFHSIYFLYKGQEKIKGGVASVQFNAK